MPTWANSISSRIKDTTLDALDEYMMSLERHKLKARTNTHCRPSSLFIRTQCCFMNFVYS